MEDSALQVRRVARTQRLEGVSYGESSGQRGDSVRNVQGAAGGPRGWSRPGRGQGTSYRPGRSWQGSPFCSEPGGGWEHGDHRETIVAGPMRGGSCQSPRGAGVRGGTSVCCDRQSEGKHRKLSGLQNVSFQCPTEVSATAPPSFPQALAALRLPWLADGPLQFLGLCMAFFPAGPLPLSALRSLGLGSTLIHYDLYLVKPAETRFPNKVTSWGSGWTGSAERHCEHSPSECGLKVGVGTRWLEGMRRQ